MRGQRRIGCAHLAAHAAGHMAALPPRPPCPRRTIEKFADVADGCSRSASVSSSTPRRHWTWRWAASTAPQRSRLLRCGLPDTPATPPPRPVPGAPRSRCAAARSGSPPHGTGGHPRAMDPPSPGRAAGWPLRGGAATRRRRADRSPPPAGAGSRRRPSRTSPPPPGRPPAGAPAPVCAPSMGAGRLPAVGRSRARAAGARPLGDRAGIVALQAGRAPSPGRDGRRGGQRAPGQHRCSGGRARRPGGPHADMAAHGGRGDDGDRTERLGGVARGVHAWIAPPLLGAANAHASRTPLRRSPRCPPARGWVGSPGRGPSRAAGRTPT